MTAADPPVAVAGVSELTKRVAFALIVAPLSLLILYWGGAPLATLLGFLSAMVAWELYRLARWSNVHALRLIGIPIAGLIPLAAHTHRLGLVRSGQFFKATLTVAAVSTLALLALAIWRRGPHRHPLLSVSVTAFGVVYSAMLAYLYAHRYHPYTIERLPGFVLAAMPLVLTWATDIGAFFTGRAFGRRKLMPSVSPGKSWEGAAGGLAVAVVVAWVYVTFFLRPYAQLSLAPWAIVVYAALLSVFAQTGDLAESMLKREAGVKDSSTLFPGHGGALDRFDSLLFVLPLSYLLLGWWLIPAPA